MESSKKDKEEKNQNNAPKTTKTLPKPLQKLKTGTLFAERYHVLEQLGIGGMGVVYKAEDTKLKRTIALKLLRPEYMSDPEFKQRFINEAQAAAALDHQNICTVFEVDHSQGQDFISMAFVEGETLQEVKDSKQMDVSEAINIIIQVADGLSEAHEKGIVHRDIKSSNIMITRKGQVKIMDFGIAKLAEGSRITKTTRIMGTMVYMSPEQACGKPVDHRTDIWSLGVVLYELLSGNIPFEKNSEQAVLYSILYQKVTSLRKTRPDIPHRLEKIINQCLEKQPSKRYQSASALMEDLQSLRNERQSNKRKRNPPFVSLFSVKTALIGGVILCSAFLFWIVLQKKDFLRREVNKDKKVPPLSQIEYKLNDNTLKISDITHFEQGFFSLKINRGKGDDIQKGDTGRLFYEIGNKGKPQKEYIGYFYVKNIFEKESELETIYTRKEITGDCGIEFDSIPKATLVVDTEPTDADIYLNNKYKGKSNLKFRLEPDKYSIKIKLDNYKEKNQIVELGERAVVHHSFKLSYLKPHLGRIFIDSSPSGAGVYFGNKNRQEGITPFSKSLNPGKYIFKLKLKNYEEEIQEIEINPDKTLRKNYSLVPVMGIIKITTTPSSADIFLGKKDTPEGKSPFIKKLSPGNYHIRVFKEGFAARESEITVNSGKTSEGHFTLDPASLPKYTLEIYTLPEGGKIRINDQLYEKTTPLNVELKDPHVRLSIEKDDYKKVEEDLILEKTHTVKTYTLKKLGKGKLIITAYPQAKVEINGKTLEGQVPPMRTIELNEGEHQIKFIFQTYGEVIQRTIHLEKGEEKRLHEVFDIENQNNQLKSQYKLSAYPRAELCFNGRNLGRVPPLTNLKVDPGTHHIEYILRTTEDETIQIRIEDIISGNITRKIHLVFDEIQKGVDDLTDNDQRGIQINSNENLKLEVNGRHYGEISGKNKFSFIKIKENNHILDIQLLKPEKKYNIEIFLNAADMKITYRIDIQISSI